MKTINLIFFLLVIVLCSISFPSEFPAQARLFLGSTAAKPDNLNQEMTAQGLKTFDSIGKYGVEITYPVIKWLNVGMSYSKRYLAQYEINDAATDYEGVINQDSVLLLARASLYKVSYFLVDAFAGVGGSNTTFNIRSATQNGELTRREGKDWLATPIMAAGVSAGVGYKSFYFYVEAGMETNKVDGFQRTGTINNNIQTIDLSGSYFSVGILFDGIKAHTKD